MTLGNSLARLINNTWPSSIPPRKTATERRRPASGRHNYDKLQQRNLLATFTGTGGSDEVVINFVGGRPATIEINGQSFVNPDDTLHIDLINQNNTGEFLTLQGDDFNVFVSVDSGTVNDGAVTFTYQNFLVLETGDGNDVIEEDGNLGASDPFSGQRTSLVLTGAGDDTFIYNGAESLVVRLGDGDDHHIQNNSGQVRVDGGAGNDIWESTQSDAFFNDTGFERVIGLEGGNNTTNTLRFSTSRLTIDDTFARLVFDENPFGLTETVFENFNHFSGDDRTANVIVRETSNPLTISGVNLVNLGGDFQNGDTSAIRAQVTVSASNTLIVSQSGSDQAQNVFVSESAEPETYQILGLTQRAIFVRGIGNTILAGGSGNDRFFVSEYEERDRFPSFRSPTQLVLYGNEGDDLFFVGHNQNETAKDVGLAANILVNIVAGSGNDYVRVDDSDSDANRHLRVRNNFIHSTGSSPNTDFEGVRFTGVEDVELRANQFTDQFLILPSQETRFVISGGQEDLEFNSLYVLQENFRPISTLIGSVADSQIYTFRNGFQSIFIRV